jgi:DNA helicase-2/ATP-dependent DNA helicase PcrA
MSGHLSRLATKKYDLYDIAALALIHYRITQKEPNQEFGLLFLDEAQDFGIGAYYVLKKLLPATYFTIMGDVSQNINYHTGLNDWYDLQKLFLFFYDTTCPFITLNIAPSYTTVPV